MGSAERQAASVTLAHVEYAFLGLLVVLTVAVIWFSCYVVYRLFADQR